MKTTHKTAITLDHQRGGWMAHCCCGWEAKRTHQLSLEAIA